MLIIKIRNIKKIILIYIINHFDTVLFLNYFVHYYKKDLKCWACIKIIQLLLIGGKYHYF